MTTTIHAIATWNSFDPRLDILTMGGQEFTLKMNDIMDVDREDLDPVTDALTAHYGAANWLNDGLDIQSMPHPWRDGEWIASLEFTIRKAS